MNPAEVEALLLSYIDSRQSKPGTAEARKQHIIDCIEFMAQPEIRSRIFAIHGVCDNRVLKELALHSGDGFEMAQRIIGMLCGFALAVIYESPELEKVREPNDQ